MGRHGGVIYKNDAIISMDMKFERLNNTRDLGGIAVTEGFGLIEEDIAAMREMYLEYKKE